MEGTRACLSGRGVNNRMKAEHINQLRVGDRDGDLAGEGVGHEGSEKASSNLQWGWQTYWSVEVLLGAI